MPTYVSGSNSTFTPAPEGTHQAVCVDVIDNGEIETQWGKKRKVTLKWQIEDLMDNGKRFLIQKRYTASLHEKAVLRHELEAWRGRAFNFDELAQFDLDAVIGANCLISVIHKKGDKGGTFANIASIAPLLKNMKPLAPLDYVRDKDKTPQQHAEHATDGPAAPQDVDERQYEDDVPF